MLPLPQIKKSFYEADAQISAFIRSEHVIMRVINLDGAEIREIGIRTDGLFILKEMPEEEIKKQIYSFENTPISYEIVWCDPAKNIQPDAKDFNSLLLSPLAGSGKFLRYLVFHLENEIVPEQFKLDIESNALIIGATDSFKTLPSRRINVPSGVSAVLKSEKLIPFQRFIFQVRAVGGKDKITSLIDQIVDTATKKHHSFNEPGEAIGFALQFASAEELSFGEKLQYLDAHPPLMFHTGSFLRTQCLPSFNNLLRKKWEAVLQYFNR